LVLTFSDADETTIAWPDVSSAFVLICSEIVASWSLAAPSRRELPARREMRCRCTSM